MLVMTRQVVRCVWALYCVTFLTILPNNVVQAFSTCRTTTKTITVQQEQKWRNNNNDYNNGVVATTRTTKTSLGMADEGKNDNTADQDDTRTANISPTTTTTTTTRRRKRDRFRQALGQLAKLSLEDYKWRSSVFKTNEADRLVEQSLARMMGEDPSYVRPMDASDSKIGPLGRAEKDAVVWLSKVIEEEGKRAEIIANSNGQLVRPIDLISSNQGVENDEEPGPLAAMEQTAVNFVNQIRDSEKERAANGVIRPKDLDETRRGPLGEAEFKAVSKFQEIREAEKVRAQQSKLRQGEVVRPIDVPGPLGEIEMKALELVEAEQQRAKDRQENDGRLVRPKDATVQGPLGKAEAKAIDAVGRLQEEEKERLRNIQRVLEENRPMEANRDSPLGFTEAFTVGLLRGPQMFMQVADRVKELLRSEKLNDQDKKLIKDQQQNKINPADKEDTKSKETDTFSSS